jgi:formate hydrogenlyase subunit 6/NADH:ubiquinone oxidoreductase subunit I
MTMANPFALPMLWRAVRNLFSRPATRRYPLETRPRPADARGRVTVDLPTCVYCGLCVRRCPCEAISVSREDKTFCLEALRCISCGACVDACNKGTLGFAPEALAVQERGGVVERYKGEEPEKT